MSSCTSHAIHCPPPVVFVPPLILAATSKKAENGLAAVGRLEVHLRGGSVDAPDEGVAAWFADSFGMFRKQTERYSVREFLEKYSKFLSETSLRNILLIEIDYTMVYYDRKQENPDDLDLATRAAYEYLIQHMTDSTKIVISAIGKTNIGLRDDLQLQVEAQFYRKHGFGKPGVEIDIVGIPSALVKQDKETKQDYDIRLKHLTQELEDSTRDAAIRTGHEETMKTILADYEQHLAALFDIDKVTGNVVTRPAGYSD